MLTGGSRTLERSAARGDLVRLRAGVYASAGNLDGLTDSALHLARVAAARGVFPVCPVFSHESAAALHGIPLIGDWPDRVHITVQGGNGRSSGSTTRTRRRLRLDEVAASADGTRMTSLARTAVDLAATRSLLGGMVAMCHVRGQGLALEALESTASDAGLMGGVRKVRSAISRSSGRCESVLETLTLARCQDFCFASPEQQRAVRGTDGRDYRVDFSWDAGRVILEVDGRSKYDELARSDGRSPAEVAWAEKRREDAIRPGCEHFIRLGWSEVWRGHELLRRLDAAGVPRRDRCVGVLTF